jgi:hypothetical protein
MNMTFHFSLFSKASMNRQLQLVQKLQEDEPANLDEEHPKEKQPNGSTTLHQSSIVRWLSLSDLLESIKNAYPNLVILLNKNGQSARIQSINMDLVDKLITFLRPWRIILSELQRTNTPSLFLVLPCITYILDELATGVKREKGGEYHSFYSFYFEILPSV